MWFNTFTVHESFDLKGFAETANKAGVRVSTEKRNLGPPPHFTAVSISGTNREMYEKFVSLCKRELNLDTEREYKDLDHG